MFCARCGHATGGSQGHHWKWCSATKALADRSHFCCPGSCELVDGKAMDRSAPCHPDADGIAAWVATKDAERENMAVWREMVGGDARLDCLAVVGHGAARVRHQPVGLG